ncbi:MBL fold metallo-hydrolase [Peribacillus frigoritolerans]|uniref:MBL fold metallo-hydrolase n=1 Tax=Peribacillus frigoritolerans TaxID=450367 RepID=UPI0039A3564E
MMKIIKILISTFILLLLFLNLYPPLGRRTNKEKVRSFTTKENFAKGKFQNQIPASQAMSLKHTGSILRDFIKPNPKRRPDSPIVIGKKEPASKNSNKITWFGHSAFMLELDGKTILVDPMFGKAPTPFPWFGNKRFSGELPFDIDMLPPIDAVLLSHDHYDHLDYFSIKKLKDKVNQFIVPLGVGGHLERWGVKQELIQEHNWWDETSFKDLQFICTPARHFSGRSLGDGNTTLWCSWIIKGKQEKVYFSGDSGYGSHFKEIGEKYGPFDLTLMECGQYDERWSTIHMIPEETVQAHIDVQGKRMIPIHWAGFTLSFHDWTDPIERVTKAANDLGVQVCTPQIGEPVVLGSTDFPQTRWWK